MGSLVLLWCLPVIVWSSLQLTMNTSAFPEIDFAAKLGGGNILEGLSNAESKGIVKNWGKFGSLSLGETIRNGADGAKRGNGCAGHGAC